MKTQSPISLKRPRMIDGIRNFRQYTWRQRIILIMLWLMGVAFIVDIIQHLPKAIENIIKYYHL